MKQKPLLAILAIAIFAAIAAYMYLTDPKTAQAPTGTAKAAPMVAVNVPDLTGAAILGQTAFNAKCAVCHGANAAGQLGIAPPLIHKIYEPSHHGDMAFVMATQNGVKSHHWRFGDMPPVEGLTNGDLKNIIAYVRAVQQANGIN